MNLESQNLPVLHILGSDFCSYEILHFLEANCKLSSMLIHVQLDLFNCTVKNCVSLENCVILQMTNFLLNKFRQKLRQNKISLSRKLRRTISSENVGFLPEKTCVFGQI